MAYSKDLYKERKESGLCVKCGKENDTSGVLCSRCKDCGNKSQRMGYSYYIGIGICPRCKKEKLYGDERVCLTCSADRYGRQLNRDRDRANEVHRKSARKIYAESSAKGICTRCNKRKAVEGQKRCKMCIERRNEYRRSKRGIPRRLRPDFGLCYLCGDTAKEGQKVCARCHESITQGNRRQDRSGRPDFIFGKKMYDWEARKERVG